LLIKRITCHSINRKIRSKLKSENCFHVQLGGHSLGRTERQRREGVEIKKANFTDKSNFMVVRSQISIYSNRNQIFLAFRQKPTEYCNIIFQTKNIASRGVTTRRYGPGHSFSKVLPFQKSSLKSSIIL
jgi:hypothetical protein